MPPQKKITFSEMRSGGSPTAILVYCVDLCSHSIEMPADQREAFRYRAAVYLQGV
jgi:hypothetical protein